MTDDQTLQDPPLAAPTGSPVTFQTARMWLESMSESCVEARAALHFLEMAGVPFPADVQDKLMRDHQKMYGEEATSPTDGKGSRIDRWKLRGAMEYSVRLSNWIDRKQIDSDKERAGIEIPKAAVRKSLPSHWVLRWKLITRTLRRDYIPYGSDTAELGRKVAHATACADGPVEVALDWENGLDQARAAQRADHATD